MCTPRFELKLSSVLSNMATVNISELEMTDKRTKVFLRELRMHLMFEMCKIVA